MNESITTKIFVNNEAAIIFEIAAKNIVFVMVKGDLSGSSFRQAGASLIEVFEKNNTSKLLLNLRNMQFMSKEDQAWASETFPQKLFQLGLRHVATVRPLNIFSEITLNKIRDEINNKFDSNFKMESFHNEEQALEWLSAFN
ncbi:STAS/SEC14 domain-containing protein [Flexithrix dorotheae]|uniref:STAS/SEC14 domain-containing protein n=1 Tax=Flexithrix dorotheae TaxID=70993 RepID=UPI0003750ADC|nr:STAS/SEC14 domain-containing protein [Flexithrix dorotheae]